MFYWSAIPCTFALGTAADDLATKALGDMLTQAKTHGGLGMGAMWTSAIFLKFLANFVYIGKAVGIRLMYRKNYRARRFVKCEFFHF
jgi:uncharacterized membrane-anchored protein